MEQLYTIAVWAVLIIVGLDILLWVLVNKHRDKLEQRLQELKKAQESDIRVLVEKHQDCLYFFREDNDGFVVQGQTKKEVLEKIKNLPIKLIIVGGDKDAVSQIEDWLK